MNSGGPPRTVVCQKVDRLNRLPHPRAQTAPPLAITGEASKVAVSHVTPLPRTLLLLSAPKAGLGILRFTNATEPLLPLPHLPPSRLINLVMATVMVTGEIMMESTKNVPLKRAQPLARPAWMHAPSLAWQVIMSVWTRPRNSNLVVVARR